MADIDLKGDPDDESTWWKPIGSDLNNKSFEGIFEGNDFSVNGIYEKMQQTTETAGFFGKINNATIKNLTVTGNIIVGDISDSEIPAAGGLIGVTYGNCEIINCINEINVEKVTTGRETAGIIAAIINGATTISNCVNKGEISGGNNCGGFIGALYGTLIIKDSYNEGMITNIVGNYTGGLIGRDGYFGEDFTPHDITIKNSYNIGTVTGQGNVGGLIGRVGYNTTNDIKIENCYNAGEIIQKNNNTGTLGAAGIIACMTGGPGKLEIINCYNIKDIKAEQGAGQRAGGIMGLNRSQDAKIVNCLNTGNITGGYASGIVGSLEGAKLNITNCYSSGLINGAVNSGGIVNLTLATATIDIQNVYYLKTAATAGVTNYTSDDTEPLEENYMKSADFVKQLNDNQTNIETEAELKKWELKEGDYPILKK